MLVEGVIWQPTDHAKQGKLLEMKDGCGRQFSGNKMDKAGGRVYREFQEVLQGSLELLIDNRNLLGCKDQRGHA